MWPWKRYSKHKRCAIYVTQWYKIIFIFLVVNTTCIEGPHRCIMNNSYHFLMRCIPWNIHAVLLWLLMVLSYLYIYMNKVYIDKPDFICPYPSGLVQFTEGMSMIIGIKHPGPSSKCRRRVLLYPLIIYAEKVQCVQRMAPSINMVLWHSTEDSSTGNVPDIVR